MPLQHVQINCTLLKCISKYKQMPSAYIQHTHCFISYFFRKKTHTHTHSALQGKQHSVQCWPVCIYVCLFVRNIQREAPLSTHSESLMRIWPNLGIFSFYKPPGASYTAQGPQKHEEILNHTLFMHSKSHKTHDNLFLLNLIKPTFVRYYLLTCYV